MKTRETYQTPNTLSKLSGSQSVGAKLHWTKGKQPGSQFKVPKSMLSASKVVSFRRH